MIFEDKTPKVPRHPRRGKYKDEKITNVRGTCGTWVESIKFLFSPKNLRRYARVWVPEKQELETLEIGFNFYVYRNGVLYVIKKDEQGRFVLVEPSKDEDSE